MQLILTDKKELVDLLNEHYIIIVERFSGLKSKAEAEVLVTRHLPTQS